MNILTIPKKIKYGYNEDEVFILSIDDDLIYTFFKSDNRYYVIGTYNKSFFFRKSYLYSDNINLYVDCNTADVHLNSNYVYYILLKMFKYFKMDELIFDKIESNRVIINKMESSILIKQILKFKKIKILNNTNEFIWKNTALKNF